jgi:nucleoporin SEH1
MDGRVYIYEALDIMNLSDWTLDDCFDAFEPPLGSQITRNAGVRCLAWNPSKYDHPMIVVGSEGNDENFALVRVWQYQEAARKWVMCCELDRHERYDSGGCQVNDVDWAPNMGRSYHLIASAGQDSERQLKIHRLNRTPEGLVPVPGPNADILASADQPQGIWRVQFNVTGTVLASSGEEGVVRLWKSTFRGDWKEVKAIPSVGV